MLLLPFSFWKRSLNTDSGGGEELSQLEGVPHTCRLLLYKGCKDAWLCPPLLQCCLHGRSIFSEQGSCGDSLFELKVKSIGKLLLSSMLPKIDFPCSDRGNYLQSKIIMLVSKYYESCLNVHEGL